jgi:FkbM family methyltransferase
MTVRNRLRKALDRWPTLRKPAYAVWVGAMKSATVLLDVAVRKFGYVPRSLSDRGQDRWIIDEVFPQKTGGFFLELGAADGFSDSNTYVLEKRYGWRGICIEPHPELFDALVNRYKRSCTCVPLAVDCERGSVEFVLAGQTSGLLTDESDNSPTRRPHQIKAARARGRIKVVEALPLHELLDKHGAPPVVDYFSFDVEGLETRILRNFPFNRYTFLAITIERPTPELNALLFRHGYHFVRNSLYDTFYVHETLPNFARIKREPFEQLPAKDF